MCAASDSEDDDGADDDGGAFFVTSAFFDSSEERSSIPKEGDVIRAGGVGDYSSDDEKELGAIADDYKNRMWEGE